MPRGDRGGLLKKDILRKPEAGSGRRDVHAEVQSICSRTFLPPCPPTRVVKHLTRYWMFQACASSVLCPMGRQADLASGTSRTTTNGSLFYRVRPRFGLQAAISPSCWDRGIITGFQRACGIASMQRHQKAPRSGWPSTRMDLALSSHLQADVSEPWVRPRRAALGESVPHRASGNKAFRVSSLRCLPLP